MNEEVDGVKEMVKCEEKRLLLWVLNVSSAAVHSAHRQGHSKQTNQYSVSEKADSLQAIRIL